MPEEVSNPYGLSDRAQHEPAMLAASYEAATLKDKAVVDVNGQKLGNVASAFAEEGMLTRLDVHLSRQAKQLFNVEEARDVAGIPATAIARVEGDEVRLSQAAEQILHPEDPRPAHASPDERGAPELPRKIR
ncbi:MAG TPA: hypothetical protein VFH78_02180 [Candidatus Thermoplasmatota archaeon]|nr:hypothetical protein [Candidatus Thermoplasmatota archaeon]